MRESITTELPVHDRLALALDTDDLVSALRLARNLEPWFGVAKVGLELFTATGPETVSALIERGWRVFLDLKLHDIPTTIYRTARVLGGLGPSFVTMHTHGGVDMLQAGLEGLHEGAEGTSVEPPAAIGVTILTSDNTAPPHILGKRVALAVEGGCRGIVSAAADVHEAKQIAPRIMAVVPGIRLPGGDPHDQARAATPGMAIGAGADLLVVGRAVTAADDREAAASALTAAVEHALAP